MILLVAYERRPYRQVPAFIRALELRAAFVKPAMKGVWLVDTLESPDQLSTRLRTTIETTEALLVVRLTSDFAGWLDPDVIEWLQVSERNGDFR